MLLYVKQDIPFRLLAEHKFPNSIGCVFVKRKCGCYVFCYVFCFLYYNNILNWRDLNCETSHQYLDDFCIYQVISQWKRPQIMLFQVQCVLTPFYLTK